GPARRDLRHRALERHEPDPARWLHPADLPPRHHRHQPHSQPRHLAPLTCRLTTGERPIGYQSCIDIGGTFTDCLVSDDKGEISIFKSPTTPGEFERGFINVLHVAAEGYDTAPDQFLKEIDLIVHGSTVSTNALVEKKTVKVGLIL